MVLPPRRTTMAALVLLAVVLGGRQAAAQCAPAPDPAGNQAVTTDRFGNLNVHIRCSDVPGGGGGGSGGTAATVNSGAWTDGSYTANATASVPGALAATSSRISIDIENLNAPGGAAACLNFGQPAVASGAGCAPGSIPVFAGGARTWDQPGNVSPEAISIVCTAAACPLTIKVR